MRCERKKYNKVLKIWIMFAFPQNTDRWMDNKPGENSSNSNHFEWQWQPSNVKSEGTPVAIYRGSLWLGQLLGGICLVMHIKGDWHWKTFSYFRFIQVAQTNKHNPSLINTWCCLLGGYRHTFQYGCSRHSWLIHMWCNTVSWPPRDNRGYHNFLYALWIVFLVGVEVYLHHFAWHVEQDWNHRRVVIAVDDEAHLLQLSPEVSGVLCQLANPSNASN